MMKLDHARVTRMRASPSLQPLSRGASEQVSVSRLPALLNLLSCLAPRSIATSTNHRATEPDQSKSHRANFKPSDFCSSGKIASGYVTYVAKRILSDTEQINFSKLSLTIY